MAAQIQPVEAQRRQFSSNPGFGIPVRAHRIEIRWVDTAGLDSFQSRQDLMHPQQLGDGRVLFQSQRLRQVAQRCVRFCRSARWAQLPGDQLQQRRFAAAVGADQPGPPGWKRTVQIGQGAFSRGPGKAEVIQGNWWCQRHAGSSRECEGAAGLGDRRIGSTPQGSRKGKGYRSR
ncbi:hypothetical protein D3C74_314690 [compost metagenome]